MTQTDEVLPGQDRPRSRWPARLGAAALVAAAAAGVVSLAQNLGGHELSLSMPPSATATPSTSGPPTSDAPVVSPSLSVPPTVRVAILAAFPGARTAVVSAIVVRNKLVSRHYGARTDRSTVDIEIDADRPGNEAVLRTPTSVQLVQQILGDRVSITVTARRGSTTQTDFRAVQQLIRDPRLLATG